VNGPIAPISLTGPPAIAALLALWWYYARLNRGDVPPSRRKIRQVSIVIMVLEIPLLLVGTSFLDYRTDQERFVWVWLAAIVLLVLVMWIMVVDAVNSMILGRRKRREIRLKLMQNLQRAETEFRQRRLKRGDETEAGAAMRGGDEKEKDAESHSDDERL
jgi:peptidoglycan/LPS O-acetylase OafA/YrhL